MSKISNKLKKNICKCADYLYNDPYWRKFANENAGSATPVIDKNVNHPTHYKGANGMEAIDVIEAFNLDRDFCLGNCAKYLLRLGKKDNILQDAMKCRWYLDRFIGKIEAEQHVQKPYEEQRCRKYGVGTYREVKFEVPSDYGE